MDKTPKKYARSVLVEEMWRRGTISILKLDPTQKEFDRLVKESKEKIPVILSSRRLGKSWWALVHSIETCLQKENAVVKFVAPTKEMINDIIEKTMPQILEDCPAMLRPVQMKSKYVYRFHNGSRLEMAGINSGHADKIRGSFADLCIVDEAGFCNDLLNTVRSVLIPTTTNTGGKIVLLSTPPTDLEHDFLKLVEDAESRGVLIKKTIYDNPRITPEMIESILAAYPGREKHPDFKREYLCQIRKNEEYSVLPEFDDDLIKLIVKDWKKPPMYEGYVGMDLGFKDLTVVIFGYYDFRAAKLIIEDEIVMNFQEQSNTLQKLVGQIYEKENKIFADPLTHEIKPPTARVSDINYIVTKEIYHFSNGRIHFTAAKKDDKQAAINNLRIMLASERVIINPRCEVLIRHLKNARWSKTTKNTFERSTVNGHYDALDAMLYLTRAVDYTKNPYPKFYDYDSKDLYVRPGNNDYGGASKAGVEAFKSIFKIGKKHGR